MRAHAPAGFEVLGVHQQAHELVTVAAEPEQDADAHVVAAAFLGAVHRLGVPLVVALGAGGVQALVVFLVVGLLEQDVRADTGFVQLAVGVHVRRGDIDIDAADAVPAFADAVDGLDAVDDVFQRVVARVLAGFDREALVADADQRADLLLDLLLGELPAGNRAVLGVVGTVGAPVDAVVGQIQGREKHDPVAVETMLDRRGERIDLLFQSGFVAVHQDGGFPVGQALAQGGLLQDFKHTLVIATFSGGFLEGIEHLLVVDEFLGVGGLGVIHDQN